MDYAPQHSPFAASEPDDPKDSDGEYLCVPIEELKTPHTCGFYKSYIFMDEIEKLHF